MDATTEFTFEKKKLWFHCQKKKQTLLKNFLTNARQKKNN